MKSVCGSGKYIGVLLIPYPSSPPLPIEVIPFSSEEIKSHLKDYQTIYKKYAKIIETDDETITTVPLTN